MSISAIQRSDPVTYIYISFSSHTIFHHVLPGLQKSMQGDKRVYDNISELGNHLSGVRQSSQRKSPSILPPHPLPHNTHNLSIRSCPPFLVFFKNLLERVTGHHPLNSPEPGSSATLPEVLVLLSIASNSKNFQCPSRMVGGLYFLVFLWLPQIFQTAEVEEGQAELKELGRHS